MLDLRDAIPKTHPLATAEFTTLRVRLLKIAARIIETATRVRIAFAAACPEAAFFRGIAAACNPQDRDNGAIAPSHIRSRQHPTPSTKHPDIAMKQATRRPAPNAHTATPASTR